MASLIDLINSLVSANADLTALALLLVFLPLFVAFTARAKAGSRMNLRPIPLYTRVRQLASHATESGDPIQVSMGTGQIGSEATPEATMGLTVFDYVARHAATCDQTIQGVAGDATLLAAAQGLVQVARSESGYPDSDGGREAVFCGPDPLAYAAGSAATFRAESHLALIALGQFGSEGLWLSEALADASTTRLGGTTDPSSAALMSASLDDTVIGEDVFAAGAYLHRPSHLGSLAAQDILRLVIMLGIVVGVVMTTLGYWS